MCVPGLYHFISMISTTKVLSKLLYPNCRHIRPKLRNNCPGYTITMQLKSNSHKNWMQSHIQYIYYLHKYPTQHIFHFIQAYINITISTLYITIYVCTRTFTCANSHFHFPLISQQPNTALTRSFNKMETLTKIKHQKP